jgi:hypothetical protein
LVKQISMYRGSIISILDFSRRRPRSKYSLQHSVLIHHQSMFLPQGERPNFTSTENLRLFNSLSCSVCAVWQQRIRCAVTQFREEEFQHAQTSELQASVWHLTESFNLNDDVTFPNDLNPDLGFVSIIGWLFSFCGGDGHKILKVADNFLKKQSRARSGLADCGLGVGLLICQQLLWDKEIRDYASG